MIGPPKFAVDDKFGTTRVSTPMTLNNFSSFRFHHFPKKLKVFHESSILFLNPNASPLYITLSHFFTSTISRLHFLCLSIASDYYPFHLNQLSLTTNSNKKCHLLSTAQEAIPPRQTQFPAIQTGPKSTITYPITRSFAHPSARTSQNPSPRAQPLILMKKVEMICG